MAKNKGSGIFKIYMGTNIHRMNPFTKFDVNWPKNKGVIVSLFIWSSSPSPSPIQITEGDETG